MVRANMNAIDWIAMVLVIVGALNWGLVGLFNFNLVSFLFGEFTALTRLIYVLVGLSGLWVIYTTMKMSQAEEPRTARGEYRV